MAILTRRAPLAKSFLFALLIAFSVQLPAQLLSNPPRSDGKVQMASLHPALVWQRTSPKPDSAVEGPVLYQIIFRSSATPGNIPMISPQFTLMNSHISDSGSALTFSEMVSFASGQNFPGAQVTGTVANATNATTANNAITAGNALLLNGVSTYARADQGNSFTTGTQAMQTGAAGTVGLAVQGASAQTANLQEWRNSTATAVASVSATGVFSGNGSGLTNLSASQFVGGGINPQQVALLKWYAANQTTSFAVGTGPFGVAFDGANIWVANDGSNTVSKL